MSLRLEVVDPAVDFPELVECKWESYEIPYQSFWRLFNPIIGTGPNARDDSLRQATIRQEKGHLSDPASHWLKVTDSNNGNKIIAGAWWKIYPSNPFEENDDEFEAFWFPEGGQRDFATAAIRQHDAPRARMGKRSQVCALSTFQARQKNIADIKDKISILFSHTRITGVKVQEICSWNGGLKRLINWAWRCG